MPQVGIEPTASFLPRMPSTTEIQGQKLMSYTLSRIVLALTTLSGRIDKAVTSVTIKFGAGRESRTPTKYYLFLFFSLKINLYKSRRYAWVGILGGTPVHTRLIYYFK